MALVCDNESTIGVPKKGAVPPEADDDLEDGEIEDDEDEAPSEAPPVADPAPPAAAPPVQAPPKFQPPPSFQPPNFPPPVFPPNDMKADRGMMMMMRDRPERENNRRQRHDEKKKHMTEAEKSILHLRKRERMQREKWEKFRKEQTLENPAIDDFAINIEKAIANVLKKDSKQISGDEEKEEEKKSRKRKNRDKDKQKNKQRKLDSPKPDDMDDSEFLNVRGGSPGDRPDDGAKSDRSPSVRSDDSFESSYSSDDRTAAVNKVVEERRPERKNKYKKNKKGKNNKFRERSRERRSEQQAKEVCVFFLQGKCQKQNECPFSHEAVPPMKLELCKFYLMDCCAKGEKCSYMHSDFPCKFYHTGLPCLQGDNCKFAHGKPLNDGLKQILFKHIETAPREILGGYPRMSREEAFNMINVTQQGLVVKYGAPENKGPPNLYEVGLGVGLPPELVGDDGKLKGGDKPTRNRPSRWQDPEPMDSDISASFGLKPFSYGHDQDMRVNSNGDIDMRTLPPLNALGHSPLAADSLDIEKYKQEAMGNFQQDVDIRNPSMLSFGDTKDVDIRHQTIDPRILATKDVDIRQMTAAFDGRGGKRAGVADVVAEEEEDEPKLQIDDAGDAEGGVPANLPKTQRDLYLRIQAQQKDSQPEQQLEAFDLDDDINWYSDDDEEDENRLTIKMDGEEKDKEDEADGSSNLTSPPPIKPQDVVEKLGDLSKIDISAEVTKLLTSISQTAKETLTTTAPSTSPAPPPKPAPVVIRDPRQMASQAGPSDPRKNRQSSTEDREQQQQQQQQQKKISIYEQGSIDRDKDKDSAEELDVDFRSTGRPDVDLRSLHLPFKGMLNYTPAKEIDASVSSHAPMSWKVSVVEVPRPDYTGLKLNVQDAEKTGDPRLRKIFRLSTEEKDSPASPKASPKSAPSVARIDPRLKKMEEAKQQEQPGVLTYNQQLNILQSSAFFQSLTSNQKLLLNQELANHNDQNGAHDPVLNSVLTSLNLIPPASAGGAPNMGAALGILANVNKLNNPMMGPAPVLNPAILGQNPNLMNQMAQSIQQPGLLGAAPGIPNLGPAEFPMNFDPRGGGLLGNAPPPPPFGGFQDNGFQGNFVDDYYPQQDGGGNFGHGHGNRDRPFNNNRDRRRGRNNFNNRNNGNRNFRNRNNSRSNNRSHTPP